MYIIIKKNIKLVLLHFYTFSIKTLFVSGIVIILNSFYFRLNI